MKYFFIGCIIFVVLAIGVGLFVSGSPAQVRAMRLDETRAAHLANIQNDIAWYFRDKKQLPTNLEVLFKYIGTNSNIDPETKAQYEYSVKSDTQFELCATFAQSGSDNNKNYYPSRPPVMEQGVVITPGTWEHAAGHVCFERTIQKDTLTVDTQPPVPPIKY